jgi:predicted ester cyclase
VTRKSFVGTHGGELFGVPATGKQVHLDLIDIVRVSGGKIVEHWNVVDSFGLMQQLGAIPS